MMWKILMPQIKKIYYSLISRGIFPDKQKGCRKRTRGIEELLCIYLRSTHLQKKNLAMAWIDYKKADDMVP